MVVACKSPSDRLAFPILACIATWRATHVSAERGAEGTRRAVAHAFGDFGKPDVLPAEQILRDRHSPGEQISIGGRPTVRVKRSKNAERESAAACASCVTVHERAT